MLNTYARNSKQTKTCTLQNILAAELILLNKCQKDLTINENVS